MSSPSTAMPACLPRLLTIATQTAIERVVLDPKYHDLLAIVKGARNGAVYGTKVRFPHALVYVHPFMLATAALICVAAR